MHDFSVTEDDIARSRRRWETQFQGFAARSSYLFASSRKLPIYEHAVSLAREWLIARLSDAGVVPDNRTLLLVGDEHLLAAASDVLPPADIGYTHIFPNAWIHWHGTEFRGNPGWWCPIHWAINDPQRLLDFAQFDRESFVLSANETYLLSIAFGGRGTDSICRLANETLIVDPHFCEWADSV
jgi:hypothetical protein